MAEDENQEITAALAKLAEEDARAADDAGAALEWIAGDQGPGLFTQQRVQNFCWYELPAKWLTSLADKPRVAGALAQALDLLQLPRYATICRSGPTRETISGDGAGDPAPRLRWLLEQLKGGVALPGRATSIRSSSSRTLTDSGGTSPARLEPRTTSSTCTSCATWPSSSGWRAGQAACSR